MMPGRFALGVGSGEALNEHVLGGRWPAADERIEMLEEAVEVVRALWQGGYVRHRGTHYVVENARLYTLPDEPPPLYVAASGPNAAETAGRLGDGLIAVAPDRDVVEQFRRSGGEGKPRIGQVTGCWAADEATATRTALEIWPNAGIPGELSQELPLPRHFEQAAEIVREDDLAELPLGPDPERWVEAARTYLDAGFDRLYFHQVGPDQEGFFRFWERELSRRFH
jgi:G6PDH family F420-dependent oxidoreductase